MKKIFIVLVAVCTGCGKEEHSPLPSLAETPKGSNGSEFVGEWMGDVGRGGSLSVTITREQDVFLIKCKNPSGLLGG